MQHSKLTIILILISCLTLFIVQNFQVVQIQFLFWHLDMSRSLLVFLLFSSGALTGWILRGLK